MKEKSVVEIFIEREKSNIIYDKDFQLLVPHE